MRVFSRLVVGVCLAAISIGISDAQTVAPDAGPVPPAGGSAIEQTDASQIGDIIVTAQKRSERLQNVPIAVSAVTSAQLGRTGVRDIVDLKLAVPTLNVTNSAGNLTSSLRGIGSNGFGAGIENPVAVYIDGVYYASPAASLLTLNNIAQIEVLKGPQGTLFGRNATGGLIQITTRDPASKPSGLVSVNYANYDQLSGSAYLSGPLADNLFMDIAASGTNQGNGWGTNLSTGKDIYKIDHDVAVRSKLIFEPSDMTRFSLIGDYADRRDSMTGYAVYRNTISGFDPAAGRVADLGYDTNTSVQPSFDLAAGGASLRWDQDIGSLNFASISAYRKSRTLIDFDYDVSAADIGRVEQTQRDRQFSQELQLSSKSGGRLTWLVGGYYFNALSRYDPFRLSAADLGARITISAKHKTESFSGYAQATYEVVDDTRLTLGGRYTTEERSVLDSETSIFVIPLGVTLPTPTAPDMSKRFNKFTYRISLDHRFSSDVLGYASYNRGFKSGGFNIATPGSPAFAPEQLDAYEIGIKSDLLDRRVRLNLAGFYYDYQNVQVQQLNQGAITVINGAAAHVYGIDADLTVQVSEALRLTTGAGWISPKFASFPNCPVSTPQGGTPSIIGSCTGNQLPLAARFTGNIVADYTKAIGNDTITLNANLYYNSGNFQEADNAIKQNGYALLGTSLTYAMDSGFSIGVFGKNLTQQRVINFETTIPNGTHGAFYQAPRTYGVTAGFKF